MSSAGANSDGGQVRDHMAIMRPQFTFQNPGILRNFGDQTAIGGGQISPRFQRILN
jgi:hypothetical protein